MSVKFRVDGYDFKIVNTYIFGKFLVQIGTGRIYTKHRIVKILKAYREFLSSGKEYMVYGKPLCADPDYWFRRYKVYFKNYMGMGCYNNGIQIGCNYYPREDVIEAAFYLL